MSFQYSYVFNNLTGMRSDAVDQTQTQIQNSKFGDYQVTNNFSNNISSGQTEFATTQPGFLAHNIGPAPVIVDSESTLFMNNRMDRHYEKLQLIQRPFLTVPYMGRGAGDPTVESQLLQGETEDKHKSINPTFEKPEFQPDDYPMQDDLKNYILNPANNVEEMALEGWRRGGVSARENGMKSSTITRPVVNF
jgi:hypothetical protein